MVGNSPLPFAADVDLAVSDRGNRYRQAEVLARPSPVKTCASQGRRN